MKKITTTVLTFLTVISAVDQMVLGQTARTNTPNFGQQPTFTNNQQQIRTGSLLTGYQPMVTNPNASNPVVTVPTNVPVTPKKTNSPPPVNKMR